MRATKLNMTESANDTSSLVRTERQPPHVPGNPPPVVRPDGFILRRFRWAKSYTRALLTIASPLNLRKGLHRVLRGEWHILSASVRNLVAQRLALGDSRKTSRTVVEYFQPVQHPVGAPLVSIVIPCVNHGAFVAEAVNSALAQTFKDLEIIVVEGGSTDDTTPAAVAAVAGPRVNVFFRDGGPFLPGDNRNFGISKARGRYICCLDADDRLTPTYVEKLLFLLEYRGYDVASSSMRHFGARTGSWVLPATPTLTNLMAENCALASAIFRKDLWLNVGGYFDFGRGQSHVAEDWDFWLRAAANGARFRNVPGETLFEYRTHASGSLSNAAGVRTLAEQRLDILERNRSALTPTAIEQSHLQAFRSLRADRLETPMSTAMLRETIVAAPQRTLVVALPFFIIGGGERLLSQIIGSLVQKGWRVIAFSTEYEGDAKGDSIGWFEQHISEVYALPRFLDAEDWRDFVMYIFASRRPDALLIVGSRFFYDLLPELVEKYPDMARLDLLFNAEGHVKKHLQYRHLFTNALCENRQVLTWLCGPGGWSETDICCIPSGIDTAIFQPTNRPDEMATRLGIGAEDVVVGWLGRISEEKSPEVFVELAVRCRDIENVHFVMAGGGRMTDHIKQQISRLPAGTRFHFLGLVDDVVAIYPLYDIYTLTSKIDGRPIAVMEAMASGCAVLASRTGGLPDLVPDGVAGLLAVPADAASFEAQLRHILADRPRLAGMRHAATETARHFSLKEMTANYGAALDRAVAKTQHRQRPDAGTSEELTG
jgi:glycosyltransferase involved in cell wall biosynthesis/GT2 family glycosyltransferase